MIFISSYPHKLRLGKSGPRYKSDTGIFKSLALTHDHVRSVGAGTNIHLTSQSFLTRLLFNSNNSYFRTRPKKALWLLRILG